jgi:hypothetical protein
MSTQKIAADYLRAGLSVLPADAAAKRPAVATWSWTKAGTARRSTPSSA